MKEIKEYINYAFAPKELGEVLVAATPKGLCALMFADDRSTAFARLGKIFPGAELSERMTPTMEAALKTVDGDDAKNIPLDLRGTAFQKEVWAALCEIPRGETRTYAQIAARIGRPKACRAVGSAVGANPVSVVVPCHRVVPGSGGVGNYEWGAERKAALLKAEGAALKTAPSKAGAR
ncbi:MAG: methylated-DNA--[protein]-cysteine S-methyltransferase [Alistipes sp.]|nr:methylated-DNA--[protein]-cysteine S-methyltransferase [Alistipes sp.]